MIASLPMYDWPELGEHTQAAFRIIGENLAAAGFEMPDRWQAEGESLTHWLDPELMFSQTCGYPFVTHLTGRADLLTTPIYKVRGCDGPRYSSALVVGLDDTRSTLEDFRAGRFAFNGDNSLSGYHCLRPLIGDPARYFGEMRQSDAHRNSACMVADGLADIAAIDAVCWDYFQRFEAQKAKRLRVLRWTDLLPSLPFITHGHWPTGKLQALRMAFEAGVQQVSTQTCGEELRLSGCAFLDENLYHPIRDLGQTPN